MVDATELLTVSAVRDFFIATASYLDLSVVADRILYLCLCVIDATLLLLQAAAKATAVGYSQPAEMAAVSTSTFPLLPSIACPTHAAVYLAAQSRAVVGIIPYQKMDKETRVRFID